MNVDEQVSETSNMAEDEDNTGDTTKNDNNSTYASEQCDFGEGSSANHGCDIATVMAFDSLKCNPIQDDTDGSAASMGYRVEDCFVEDEENDDNDEDTNGMEETPGGTKFYYPRCEESITPTTGDCYASIEMAEKAYRKYAEEAGFDIRLSNKKRNAEGDITARFFVCNRQGIPTEKHYDSLGAKKGERRQRNSNLKRCGCQACLKIHYVRSKACFVVYRFIEKHNHPLFDKNEMSLSRAKRGLSFTDQVSVFNATSSKVGIARSHRMRNAMKGCLTETGGTVKDFQNFKRDMVNFVGNKDAQMLINTMVGRQQACPDFFFEFKCNDKELITIFWADEVARMNYKEFGDAISFDATFRTNKYAMVFGPFVAVDNHKRSAVVGGALMRGETINNYKWVLQAFKKAHGKDPVFVITDQCAAMKQAIPAIFPESVHRLCMWHITKKVKEKISVYLAKKTNFVNDFKKVVWDVNLEPTEFEDKWQKVMQTYNLTEDSWFEELYEIRESWIPAYFKHIPMSGLMKTTSRSESINAFFNVYHAFWNDLVIFLKSFDMAIESQRKKHCAEEMKTKYTRPRLLSARNIEKHAAETYTRSVFFEFQKELNKALTKCGLDDIERVDGKKILTITQKNNRDKVKGSFKVHHDKDGGTIECSCNMFARNGILCRHALKVMFEDSYSRIPEKYIMRRWTKDLIPAQWLPARLRYGEIDARKEKMMGKIFLKVERILDRVRKDDSWLEKILDIVTSIDDDLDDEFPIETGTKRKYDVIEDILGVSRPDEVEVIPPSGVRNKGCGTGKRLKSVLERSSEEAKKQKRRCRTCHEMVRHDSRNCPMRGR